jgi:hypothetical protein
VTSTPVFPRSAACAECLADARRAYTSQERPCEISAELITITNDTRVRSKTYDRTVDEVNIAGAVVRSLSVALLSATLLAQTTSLNSEAYQRYLRGHFHWNRRSPKEFRKSDKTLQ